MQVEAVEAGGDRRRQGVADSMGPRQYGGGDRVNTDLFEGTYLRMPIITRSGTLG